MAIYTPIQCSCIVCNKEFSYKGINSHYITAHTNEGNERIRKVGIKGAKLGGIATSSNKKEQKQKDIKKYFLNPNTCITCGNDIPYEKRYNKFCSQSCAAVYTNRGRIPKKWTPEQKERNKIKRLSLKISKSLKEQKQITKNATNNPSGLLSKVCYCTCSHCNVRFTHSTRKKYCSDCDHKYSHEGRAKYWFTFNVFHYPDLFDLSLITDIGFRDNKTNPNGITRDHKISVNQAIRNDYDSYYIKHPLNCELMRFDENNKKKTNCSISYEELVSLVDNYKRTI